MPHLPGAFRYPGVVGRTFLLGAGAILAAAVALGAAVWHLTRPGPELPLAPLAPLPPAAEGAPAPLLPPGAAPPGGQAPPVAGAPPAPRAGRRGGAPGELFSALQPLGTGVGHCTARSTPAVSGSPRQEILVLDIEPLDGRVRIVGASPWEGKAPNDALLRCARSEMVGREVPLSTARPGRAYKMSYSIRY